MVGGLHRCLLRSSGSQCPPSSVVSNEPFRCGSRLHLFLDFESLAFPQEHSPASGALSPLAQSEDGDVLRWGWGTRGTWAKIIHMCRCSLSYHCTRENWCYFGRLVRKKSPFPAPSNHACGSFRNLPKLPTVTSFQKQSIGIEVKIAKAAARAI